MMFWRYYHRQIDVAVSMPVASVEDCGRTRRLSSLLTCVGGDSSFDSTVDPGVVFVVKMILMES
jgi:hypothetical protein